VTLLLTCRRTSRIARRSPDDDARRHRHRGIATACCRAAERIALERGRWLLVLDTAEDEGACGLYERLGFQLTGVIPDYA